MSARATADRILALDDIQCLLNSQAAHEVISARAIERANKLDAKNRELFEEVIGLRAQAPAPDTKAIKLARKQIESLIVTRIPGPDECDLIPRESVLTIFDRMVAK